MESLTALSLTIIPLTKCQLSQFLMLNTSGLQASGMMFLRMLLKPLTNNSNTGTKPVIALIYLKAQTV